MMKRTLTSISLLICCAGLLTLASQSAALAQSESAPPAIKDINSPASTICGAGRTFMFGAGAYLFKFCISDHGNILELQSPANFTQIGIREGYVACGTGAANAYDTGSDESGWGASTITQPGGANTLPVTIKRQSTDGKFELTQTFTADSAQKEITITMVLKNISAASITNVKLARYFDGDLSGSLNNGDAGDDIYNRDTDSVWGKDNGAGVGHHGLALTALSFAQSRSMAVESYGNFSMASFGNCSPFAENVPTAPGDYVGRLTYNLSTLAAGVSKTVKVIYRRF